MMKALTYRSVWAAMAAAAALMVFAGSASATSFTSKGSVYEGAIEASGNVEVGGVACSSTIKGEAESVTNYVTVELSQLSFTKCPEGRTVTAALPTFLRVAPVFWWVSAVGMEEVRITTANHSSGQSCTYRPAGTSSRFYPSISTKATAAIEIIQLLELEKGSPTCSPDINWSGTYTVTTPDELNIH